MSSPNTQPSQCYIPQVPQYFIPPAPQYYCLPAPQYYCLPAPQYYLPPGPQYYLPPVPQYYLPPVPQYYLPPVPQHLPPVPQYYYPQPSSTQAPVQQPNNTHAPVQQPNHTQAPVQQPSSTQAPAQEPSSTQAPVQQPSSTQAPVQQPSSTKAPVQQPSSTQAPVKQPSSTKAPVQQPSSTKAPVQQLQPEQQHLKEHKAPEQTLPPEEKPWRQNPEERPWRDPLEEELWRYPRQERQNADVQLHKSDNPWRPSRRTTDAKDTEVQKTQDILGKVRSILNKLTPEKFERLMDRITELNIDTEERFRGVVNLIADKALDDAIYSEFYAKMCKRLSTIKVQRTNQPNSWFQRLLLDRCQKEFEKDRLEDLEKKQKKLNSAVTLKEHQQLQEELEEARNKARRHSTGNARFIGELFKLKLLTKPIVYDCVTQLLKNKHPVSLECLCTLLTTVGKDLESEAGKEQMDQYFSQIKKIVKWRKTSSRIRFMLIDVFELRLNNWVPKRDPQGPKTIQEIHIDAKIEALIEEELEKQNRVAELLPNRGNTYNSPQNTTSYSVSQRPRKQYYDAYDSVDAATRWHTYDFRKMPKFTRINPDEVQLRPNGHGAKAPSPPHTSAGAERSGTEQFGSTTPTEILGRASTAERSMKSGRGL